MYVYPHSKAVLMASITRDTEFLAQHSVMDYSLLVGVDESNKQFVVGIIGLLQSFAYLVLTGLQRHRHIATFNGVWEPVIKSLLHVGLTWWWDDSDWNVDGDEEGVEDANGGGGGGGGGLDDVHNNEDYY